MLRNVPSLSVARLLASVLLLLTPRLAHPQAVVTTSLGREIPVVIPDPGAASPTPLDVSFPSGVAAVGGHGAAWASDHEVIAADSEASRLLVIDVAARAVTTIVDAPSGYGGLGTVAVNPARTHLLFGGGSAQMFVAPLPLTAAPAFTAVPLPDAIPAANTKAIEFDCSGRAFVYHRNGISVLDPPYANVSFTIPLSSPEGGSLALTPDGAQLLATVYAPSSLQVLVFDAPFSALSVAATISIPNASFGIPVAVTPDGTRALVSGMSLDLSAPIGASVWSIAAPFSAGSTVERIALPDSVRLRPGGGLAPHFEDVSISADGQIAIFTGQADEQTLAVPIVHAPFTAAGATITPLEIAGGRGAGSVRMPPVACGTPPPPSGSADLSITKSGPASAIAGTPVTFTITVRNDGPATADDVRVDDPLPPGLTFLSAETSRGTCTGTGTVNCSIGTLAAGSEAVITITVRADATGTLTNTATVVSATPDGTAGNDRAEAVVTVQAAAPVPAASSLLLLLLVCALGAIAAMRL